MATVFAVVSVCSVKTLRDHQALAVDGLESPPPSPRFGAWLHEQVLLSDQYIKGTITSYSTPRLTRILHSRSEVLTRQLEPASDFWSTAEINGFENSNS